MNAQVTNSETKMKALGMNPGLIEKYSNVSLEPISFEHESNLGWGDVYRAQHSAFSEMMGCEIEADGMTVTVAKAAPQGFRALLTAWRKAQA